MMTPMQAYAAQHDCGAGDHEMHCDGTVTINVAWINVEQGLCGVDKIHCSTIVEVQTALGY